MAEDVSVTLARIEGTLGVVKSWGLGIALFVGGVGLASLGYNFTISRDIGKLETKLENLSALDPAEYTGRLAEIQATLNELVAQSKSPPGPKSSAPQ